jgi:hypothetical protein
MVPTDCAGDVRSMSADVICAVAFDGGQHSAVSATGVLRACVVLQACGEVTRVLRGCYEGITRVSQGSYVGQHVGWTAYQLGWTLRH